MAVQTHEALSALKQFTDGNVISKDGARIAYRQLGSGPALVVLHGAMESAESHRQLAEALADFYTVYLVDRRGRGQSGAYGKDYTSQEDVEDVSAVLEKTGARTLFGVSSGAIITLLAALQLSRIQKIAIYEPPLSLTRAEATAILERYNREMAAGKLSAALVTGMLGAKMGPPIFNAMPRWALEILTNLGMNAEERQAKPGDVTMRLLAPTLRYDFQLVTEMSERVDIFHGIQAKTLLIGGSQSPAYLIKSLDLLEGIIPRCQRVLIPGVGHGGSENKIRGGQPEKVAEELRKFLTA
ncbi:MAG TPA: alpha/beta hydrolase [Anaerolineaceae bacterium]|nr:alpha/beta hydrolase [Anaerolineaceae bacterium]